MSTNNGLKLRRRCVMPTNIGTLDRIVRVIAGLALIVAPFLANWPVLGLAISVVIGAVLVATSAVSFCPIYALLGVSSKRRRLGRT
jgi:hypothetical protein